MHVRLDAARGRRCLANKVVLELVAQWVAPMRCITRAIMDLLPFLSALAGSLLSLVGFEVAL